MPNNQFSMQKQAFLAKYASDGNLIRDQQAINHFTNCQNQRSFVNNPEAVEEKEGVHVAEVKQSKSIGNQLAMLH